MQQLTINEFGIHRYYYHVMNGIIHTSMQISTATIITFTYRYLCHHWNHRPVQSPRLFVIVVYPSYHTPSTTNQNTRNRRSSPPFLIRMMMTNIIIMMIMIMILSSNSIITTTIAFSFHHPPTTSFASPTTTATKISRITNLY